MIDSDYQQTINDLLFRLFDKADQYESTNIIIEQT